MITASQHVYYLAAATINEMHFAAEYIDDGQLHQLRAVARDWIVIT